MDTLVKASGLDSRRRLKLSSRDLRRLHSMQQSPLLELFDLLHDSRRETEADDSAYMLALIRGIFLAYQRCKAVGLGQEAAELLLQTGVSIGYGNE